MADMRMRTIGEPAPLDGARMDYRAETDPEPPRTCRSCYRCEPAPWPHGTGRLGIGWCEEYEEFVTDLDKPTDCEDHDACGGTERRAPTSLWDLHGRRVYLSGPMTGIEDLNRGPFNDAQKVLEEHGAEVYNPARLSERWAPEETRPQSDREQALHQDLRELLRMDADGPYYDAVARLHGWAASDGATLENAVAKHVGIPCFDLDEVGR